MARGVPLDLADRRAFIENLVRVFGQDTAAAITQQLARPPVRIAFWRNGLIEWRGDYPQGQRLGGLPEAYVSDAREAVTRSEAAEAGAVYVQNPSSQLAVQVLDPQPGEEVLDLAAAPGGKSIAIAARMQNEGRLAVVEVVPGRFHRLMANLERCGVTLAQGYLKDGRGVGRAVGPRFDRVLLDAPCSSEARFDWSDPRSYAHWSRRKVREQTRKQKALLRSAYDALKPGGVLVYSTCSFGIEENEAIVEHLLRRTDAEIVPISSTEIDLMPGVVESQRKPFPETMSGTARIVPDDLWSGFYVARLRKP